MYPALNTSAVHLAQAFSVLSLGHFQKLLSTLYLKVLSDELSSSILFCLQALNALLADDNKFGFIVMDGNGALFGTLCGNTREVLHKFTVDLPKKHGQ